MAEQPDGFNPEDYTMDPQSGALQERQDQFSRKWVRDLEKRAKKGDEASAELARVQREMAILRAGIPTGDPLGELFLKAYDGPVDPDAIKAEAAKYGLLKIDPQQQEQIDQSLQGHQTAMQTAAGAQTQTGGVDHQAALRAIAAKHRGPNASEAAKAEIAQYMQQHGGPALLEQYAGRG